MRLLKQFLPVFTLITIVLFSCQPEIDPPPGGGNPPVVNPTPVQATVKGLVIDENDAPVAGATVKAGGQTTVTDSRGLFKFPTLTLDKYASVVTVEMNGYFKGIRTFSTKTGANNFVKIQLLSKDLAGNVNAAAGGTVTLPDNSAITINPNSVVVKSTGAAYTGSVAVYATMIDPTATDFPFFVPGSLQAINSQNERTLLTSFGMIAVELVGSGGQQLQIASGQTAKLKMTIPASLVASAPATLPLWSLNETDGLWKAEGNATKTGNYYEGNVSHFSFWNCDITNNTIYLEMTVTTNEGPLTNTLVKITRLNTNTSSYGWTDSSGYVAGFVPGTEPLKLEIFNTCVEPVYSQNIGPFTQNTNLGTILITIPLQYNLTVTGTAVNCTGQPVAAGTAFIYFEGQSYARPITNGTFSALITRCSNSSSPVEVVVSDNATNQQSTTFSGTATTGTVSTGQLSACGVSSASYINYTLDGNAFTLSTTTPGVDSFYVSVNTSGQVGTFIDAYRIAQQNIDISFYFNGAAAGTFPMVSLQVNNFDSVFLVTPFNVNVTTFGSPGQFIEGNFSGQFRDIANNLHNISATFRVRRQ